MFSNYKFGEKMCMRGLRYAMDVNKFFTMSLHATDG
jgi:hypothetical protein